MCENPDHRVLVTVTIVSGRSRRTKQAQLVSPSPNNASIGKFTEGVAQLFAKVEQGYQGKNPDASVVVSYVEYCRRCGAAGEVAGGVAVNLAKLRQLAPETEAGSAAQELAETVAAEFLSQLFTRIAEARVGATLGELLQAAVPEEALAFPFDLQSNNGLKH